MSTYPKNSLRLSLRQVTHQAELINSYEMVDSNGDDLPAYTAGSHIDFYFHDGIVRQYSLCGDPSDRKRYLIAILNDQKGRGGSTALHNRLHVQRYVHVSEPRNNFPVAKEAKHHLMIAGGIGVTPMLSMIYELQKTTVAPYHGAPSSDAKDNFTLHYCTKSKDHTAFQPELAKLIDQGKVVVHHDQGVPGNGLNIQELLQDYDDGTHLYYCGPPGFMKAVKQFSSHWPEDTVHFEYFNAPEPEDTTKIDSNNQGSQIKIASTGAVYTVPDGKTIVEVLQENNVAIETSCNVGLCKTCVIKYLEGEVKHMDCVLSKQEQEEYLTPCCSRSLGDLLILDL